MTHIFAKGKMAKAFGKILKLSYGPESFKSSIYMPSSFVKWPKYMNTFKAHSIPQNTKLAGMM
jgi:hypothetical protein